MSKIVSHFSPLSSNGGWKLQLMSIDRLSMTFQAKKLIDSESFLLRCNVALICIILLRHICMFRFIPLLRSLFWTPLLFPSFCTYLLFCTLLCFTTTALASASQNLTQSVHSHSSTPTWSEYTFLWLLLCCFFHFRLQFVLALLTAHNTKQKLC